MPEPLALEMLAATVPDYEVRILDMRVDTEPSALRDTLEQFAPNLVAITALTPEVYAALDVVRGVREFSAEIYIIIGGHHATLLPDDFCVPEMDAVALGEGEMVFPYLVAALASGGKLSEVPNLIWKNKQGEFVNNGRTFLPLDMDTLPLPRRDLVDHYRQEYFFLFDQPDSSVVTGRGCPYRCTFCSVWAFYQGKIRQMSPQRVLKEIADTNTDHITFVDDNFLLNYQRENAIADLIRAEGIDMRYSIECRTDSIVRHPELVSKWVDIGLYAVLLGLEGASDKALDDVNKNSALKVNNEAIRILHDHGIIIWGAFLVDPDWDVDDFKVLRDYVNEMEITHTQFTVLTPLPGTELYRQKFDELLTYDYTCYDTLHAVVPTRLDRVEFYKQFANLYRQTDLGPYYDLVREGKLSIEDCRRGKGMLEAMTHWEFYLDKDPVLGNVRSKSEGVPAAVLRARAYGSGRA